MPRDRPLDRFEQAALAAIQEHIIGPYTSLPCAPQIKFAGQTFHNWDPTVNEWMDMPTALAQSCDTYFYQVGYDFYALPPSRGHALQLWASRFGFGQGSGIDVGPETEGLVPTPEWRCAHFGGPRAWFAFPGWLLDLGARSGDFAARLGWAPPIRTTALVEMRRGVEGDPSAWIAVTGIEPASLQVALASTPATIQERWFGRLYLAKALVIATLALFWIASGAIALTAGFEAAADHLTSRGFPRSVANALVSLKCSPADMSWRLGVDSLAFGATKNGTLTADGHRRPSPTPAPTSTPPRRQA